jgi:iron complex outermembrane recepter protein
MLTLGLEGKLDGGWKWNVGFSGSQNDALAWDTGNWNNQRLAAALDAVVNPANGQIVCNVTLVNPAANPGCLPLNPFGPTSASAAAIAYVQGRTQFNTVTKMNSVDGSIVGSPFSTWAGPVQTALSAEWRDLSLSVDSDAQPSMTANCTDLRFNCTAGTPLWGTNTQSNAYGSQSVREGALEVGVPLLKDVAFAQAVDLNGAVRYTDYSTSGSVDTWKLGLEWHFNDAVTARATRSRDIRAPNLNELFAPTSPTVIAATDVHTGFSGAITDISGSNLNLNPEKADTWTAGLVFRPSFIPRFSLAVDWYSISIGNAIVVLDGASPTIQNECEASGGTATVCSLIVRPLPFSNHTLANTATAFLSEPVNASIVSTKGIDVEANYRTPIAGGNLTLRALSSYQPHIFEQDYAGAPRQDYAGVPPAASTRVTLFAQYAWQDLSVNVQERWRSSYAWNADPTLVFDTPRISAAAYTDLTLSYHMQKWAEVYMTVQNLFDRQPGIWAQAGGAGIVPGLLGGFAYGDDLIGRDFTLGFRIRR